MYTFSAKSQLKLNQCDHRLQAIFNEVIKIHDCVVLTGYRDKATQSDLFHQGRSKLTWPSSKHNMDPSAAVDVAPFPIDWNDLSRFLFFGGMVMAIAIQQNVRLRWGGDWNMNQRFLIDGKKDQVFDDYVHFELVD